MRINERTAIYADKIALVPYCRHHVTAYHDWMKDPDIQVATASEPLSISQEFEMQQSWRSDTDKLTFIACLAPRNGEKVLEHSAEVASMIGDVNMFVSVHEEDDGALSLVGELELMIALKDFRRKGLGRCMLLTFLYYVLQHELEIIQQFPGRSSLANAPYKFDYFVVKINESNGGSLSLFESLGFERTAIAPNFFGEFELRRRDFCQKNVLAMLAKFGLEDYCEVEYDNKDL